MKHEEILETYINAASSITTGTYVVTQAGIDRLLSDIESLPRNEVLADLNEAMKFVSKKERAVIGTLIEKLNG